MSNHRDISKKAILKPNGSPSFPWRTFIVESRYSTPSLSPFMEDAWTHRAAAKPCPLNWGQMPCPQRYHFAGEMSSVSESPACGLKQSRDERECKKGKCCGEPAPVPSATAADHSSMESGTLFSQHWLGKEMRYANIFKSLPAPTLPDESAQRKHDSIRSILSQCPWLWLPVPEAPWEQKPSSRRRQHSQGDGQEDSFLKYCMVHLSPRVKHLCF